MSGVEADFALLDDRELVLEEIFDRVLERDDVFARPPVHVIDDRGERGRFARARRAGDEDDAARRLGDAADDGRKMQLLEGANVHPHDAQGDAEPPALLIDIHAKPPDAGEGIREVDLALRLAAARADAAGRSPRRCS